MNPRFAQGLAAVAALLFAPGFAAQVDLRSALKDAALRPNWIYDDLEKAKAEARERNRPIMAVFR